MGTISTTTINMIHSLQICLFTIRNYIISKIIVYIGKQIYLFKFRVSL